MTNQKPSAELVNHRSKMRHSAAHVLAEVVLDMFPEAQLTIGPPTQDGFYYDFAVDTPFTPEDLKKIERQMRKSIGRNHPFIEREVSRDEAVEIVVVSVGAVLDAGGFARQAGHIIGDVNDAHPFREDNGRTQF